ncbi:hypothetical protein Ahy_A04g020885 [Arachis hypogaea]|uniref:Uncharacterized protein n=1 Tax=Arachis hypogaea TaxID=3818 RepID=A0A445DJ30_ARAHY|nr:hypothetical protein Ahy_A04g020885 [Arachis hypogaea]
MSDEKKAIVRDLGFGGLMHIPPLRVHHKILKESANSFKLGKNTLETDYGLFKVRQKTIGAALGLNTSGSPHVQEDFHPLYTDGVPVTNHNKQNLPCAPDTNFQDGHNNREELESTCSKFYHQGNNRLQSEKEKGNWRLSLCPDDSLLPSIKKQRQEGGRKTSRTWIANWTRE